MKALSPDVVIAKMDATANDKMPGYEVSGFPTLYFAPKNAKDKVGAFTLPFAILEKNYRRAGFDPGCSFNFSLPLVCLSACLSVFLSVCFSSCHSLHSRSHTPATEAWKIWRSSSRNTLPSPALKTSYNRRHVVTARGATLQSTNNFFHFSIIPSSSTSLLVLTVAVSPIPFLYPYPQTN